MSELTPSESEAPRSESASESYQTGTDVGTPKAVPTDAVEESAVTESSSAVGGVQKISAAPSPPLKENEETNLIKKPRRVNRSKQPVPPPGVPAIQPFTCALSTMETSPAISLSSRHYVSDQATRTPGPGAYNISPVRNTVSPKFKNALPKINYRRYSVPGPGAYSPCETKGGIPRGTSLSPKLPLKVSSRAPAPGTYNLPGCFASPGAGFSFGGNRSTLSRKHDQPVCTTPGPGAYSTEPVTSTITPGFSLGGKWKSGKPLDEPGPGSYNPDVHSLSKSKVGVTIKGRLPLLEPMMGQGPPPNQYNVRPPAPPVPGRPNRTYQGIY